MPWCGVHVHVFLSIYLYTHDTTSRDCSLYTVYGALLSHEVNHFEYAHRILSTTFCCLSSPDLTSPSSSTSTRKSWKMRRGRMPLAACRSKCTSHSSKP